MNPPRFPRWPFPALLSILLALTLPPLRAQTAPAPSGAAAAAANDQVVQMSQFEVTTTQGHGYFSGNAAEAFKTNESLMNIPQMDVVVTSDLIKDLGYTNSSDILQYAGVTMQYEGEALMMRGARIQYPYVDDTPDNQTEADASVVDAIEVVKGPAESLYINSSISGVVLKSWKKPLPYQQDSLSASLDNWGTYRLTGDFTGPIGSLGDAQFSYRLVTDYQKTPESGAYFYHYRDDLSTIFPVLEMKYKNTDVRFTYDYEIQDQSYSPNNQDLITPTGQLYTGAGRRVDNGTNSPLDNHSYNLHLDVLQKISDNWEMKLTASDWTDNRYGEDVGTDGYNWATQTEYFTSNISRNWWNYWTVLDDATGHYDLGPDSWKMRNVDVFGYAWSDWLSDGRGWGSTNTTMTYPFSDTAKGIALLPGQPANTLAVPMNSAAALNSLYVPKQSDYVPHLIGSHAETVLSAIYWQHSIDAIPNWLTLTAGFTWDNIDTLSVANVGVLPWTASQEPYSDWVHRLGATLHLGKQVSLYVLDSTSFAPASQGYTTITGALPPPQAGKGDEVGIKASLLGGRISFESAWFRLVTSNVYASAPGVSPITGNTYDMLIGDTIQEGIDGDLSLTLLPGWQLIGSWYAGHDRDTNNNPVPVSYDNSLAFYNRYDFAPDTPLHGLTVGAGLTRYGGRWISDAGIAGAVFEPITVATGMIKEATGTNVDGFIGYNFNRHLYGRIMCQNALNQVYPLGVASAYAAVASFPRTFRFEVDYKF